MTQANPMIAPAIALVLWSGVIWAWMYVTRIPAIYKARMKLDPMAPRGEQMATLPAKVRWKADNYNHLMEQPTVFYAVAIVLALAGGSGLDAQLAWGYTGLRVVHSLVQATSNNVNVRFPIWGLGSIVLIVMTVRAAMLVF